MKIYIFFKDVITKKILIIIIFFIVNNSCTTHPTIEDIDYIRNVGFWIQDYDSLNTEITSGGGSFFAAFIAAGAESAGRALVRGIGGGPEDLVFYNMGLKGYIDSAPTPYEKAFRFLELATDSLNYLPFGEMTRWANEYVIEELEKDSTFNKIVPISSKDVKSGVGSEGKILDYQSYQEYMRSHYGVQGVIEVTIGRRVKCLSDSLYRVSVFGSLTISRTDNHKVIRRIKEVVSTDYLDINFKLFKGRTIEEYFGDNGITYRNDIQSSCKILARELVNQLSWTYLPR